MRPRMTLALAAMAALLLSPAIVGAADTVVPGAAAAQAAAVTLPATTVHGSGFQVRNMSDSNFCIDVAGGGAEGRPVTLSTCNSNLSMRWTFAWESSLLNEMIDSQGMCVDVAGRKPGDGVAVAVVLCHGGRPQSLTFTPLGQIEFAKGCLAVPRTAAGAAVFVVPCDETQKTQTWKLAQ